LNLAEGNTLLLREVDWQELPSYYLAFLISSALRIDTNRQLNIPELGYRTIEYVALRTVPRDD
jgi:hypothetical protein